MPLVTNLIGRLLGDRRKRTLTFLRDVYRDARETGWLESAITGRALDGSGEPIPWITYPAIAFLETRDWQDIRVFEYGSGASTQWWAKRAKSVVSVEHDKAWFDDVRPRVPATVDYRHIALDAGYSAAIEQATGPFDIAVIDGRQRVKCAASCLKTGVPVLLWDNTDRTEYADGLKSVERAGYKRIDFRGFGPVNTYQSTTSILYTSPNRIGL